MPAPGGHPGKTFLDSRLRGNDKLEMRKTPRVLHLLLVFSNAVPDNLHTAGPLNWLFASGKLRPVRLQTYLRLFAAGL